MKVICLTAGGLTDVRKFYRSTANNSSEKSAEDIVPAIDKGEGLNLKEMRSK